jgi:hypothetical protein
MSFQKTQVQGPNGPVDGEIIPVNAFNEAQATYLLADGTTLTMRTIVMQVIRLPGHFDAEGNPAYFVKTNNVVIASSPDHLRKKAP